MNNVKPQREPTWTEAERLAALNRYGILDTPAEQEFEDLVHLAAQACAAPIAVVNLIAEGRQWFKAEVGLGICETPLDISICARVLLQPGLTVVPDLTQDNRFNCNSLVTGEPHLRFYAGALLETPDGLPLGTLCVLDYQSRPEGLTPGQAFTLQALARQTMTQIELRRALREERETKTRHQLILESATDYAIFTTDEHGNVTSWNEGARRILGWREDEILGQDARIIFTPEDREAGAPEREMGTASAQGRAEDERWHLRKDGSRFWASGLMIPLRDSSSGFLKILRDRTERLQVMREHELLTALVEQSPDFMGIATPDGRAIYVNGAGRRIVGLNDLDEVRSTHVIDYFAPEDQSFVKEVILPTQERDGRWLGEFPFRRFDTSERVPMHYNQFLIRGDAGEVIGVAAVARDVTEEKRHADALRRSEALKGAILKAALDCIITITHDSQIVEWNPAAERTFGYSASAALGQDLAQLIVPPEFRERHYKGMAHYLATGHGPVLGNRVELEALRADGSRFPVELAISPIEVDGQSHFTAYLRDISDRKRTEAALRESEQRLHSTYEHAFAGIAEIDADGRYLRVNEQFTQITGYSREELLARTFIDITHPDDVQADLEQFRRQIAREIGAYTVEKRYVHKDGHLVWIELSASRVDDAQGRPLYGVRVVRDITEQKRAEEANARLATIVSFSSDAIISVAAEDGRILTWNKGAEVLFGYTEEQAVGASVSLLVPPQNLTELENQAGIFDLALAEGQARVDTIRRRKDGSLVDVSVSAARMMDAQGRVFGVSAIYRDITERKHWERHQRLLINELNHRVKNTLATVQSIISQTLRNATTAEEARSAIETRLIALSRAHDVLTRENWEAANLSEIVFQAVAPYRSHGEDRFHCDGPEVRLSPRMALTLAMALQELATNAVKYGALSNATGEINIVWSVDQGQGGSHLRLQWRESGGPPVQAATRRGFGTRLIERGLALELNGKVRIDFAPEGVVCSVDAPIA